jgi:hypothetical protein
MMAMMENPSAGITMAEAQASAIQAIIQANYDTFLSSKRSASRLSGSWKAEGVHTRRDNHESEANGEKNDAGDKDSTSSERSEREAFERIFIGGRSMSSVSGRDSAAGGTDTGTGRSSSGSSRTRSGGISAAAVRACGLDGETECNA